MSGNWTRTKVRTTSRSAAATAVLALQAGVLAGGGGPAAAALPTDGTGPAGYDARATATPVSLLMYEEVVRITVAPEGEADLGYTDVTSATGPTGRAVASWLWPGPLVGDGLQLVTAGAGLPATSYPVKTVSDYPSGGTENGDLAPGLRQRASTSADEMSALTLVRPSDGAGDSSGDDGQPAGAAASRSGGDPKNDPTGAVATATAPVTAAEGDEPDAGAQPDSPFLDLDGLSSSSRVAHEGPRVVTEATSAVSDVALLGGLVRMESVSSTASSSTTGTRATADGDTRVVGLSIAGVPVTVDRDGVSVADQAAGSDADADLADTMVALGLSVRRTPVDRGVSKATGSAVASGLWVEVDTQVLRSAIDSGQLEDGAGALPPEVSSQLAPALRLAPRLVFRLGYAEAVTAGASGYDAPAGTGVPDDAGESAGAGDAAVTDGAGSAGTTTGAAGTGPDGSGLASPAGTPASGGTVQPSTPVALASGPGLPPLYSVPGLLFFTGLALAGGLGWWLQRMGGGVLGGGGTCAHGHLRGVPNLRKVR